MDSEMPYFLVWSLCIKCLVHNAVCCIILVLSLVLFMQSLYIPFLIIYEFFHLLVIVQKYVFPLQRKSSNEEGAPDALQCCCS